MYYMGVKKRSELVDSSNFFTELIDLDKTSINVLLVYFARPQEMWKYLFEADSEELRKNSDKILNIRLASLGSFNTDLAWADTIYFSGGDGPLLTGILSQFPELKDKLSDKVVGAISAGVNALSKYYYSRKGEKVLVGLGILNKKVFTHFEDSLTEELRELDNYGEELEVLTLPEGEFLVLEVD